MPESIEITQQVLYWPVRTRSEMDHAGWDITDTQAGFTAHTLRVFDNGTEEGGPHLQVYQGGAGEVVKVPLGSVIVRTSTMWEVISPEEAELRGITLSPTPGS